nr:uncharacterized protein K02A2.6-like [Misgurnus anguillicaudatus]
MASVYGNLGPFEESSEQWCSYTERFEYFVAANAITEAKVVPTFLSVMGPKTYTLLRNLLQPEKPGEKTYDQIVSTLKAHFSPKPLVIAERFRFHRRNQLEGESVAVFVAVLKKLAEHCEFGDVLNDTLRDRLVCGLRCEGIQKRLLTESNLTLQRAIELSVSMELAAKEAQQLSSNSKVYRMETEKQTESKGPCFRCGKTGHSPASCWFKDMECRSCKKKGHIERACRNKMEKKKMPQKPVFRRKQKKRIFTVGQENKESTDTSDEEFPLHVLTVAGGTKAYKVTALLEGQPVKMEIDTGAAVSLVSEAVYSEILSHLPLKPPDVVLKTYTGESVTMKGLTQVTVELNGQTKKLPLYVVAGDYPSLMGRSWLEQLKVDWSTIHMMTPKTLDLEGVLAKHSEVFKQELGSMEGITVKLTVKQGSQPKFLKPRPLPYALKPKVEASLAELVKNDVLEPVNVSKWATPIVPVIKKDGGIRICGDFKVTVNPVLSAEQYPLPHINDLFAGLTGGQKFSKIDLNQAYLQMHVEEQSRELLTINTHKGLFRYKRLPFGITSAPSIFQRAMDQILAGLPGVVCYLDDILVTGTDEQSHLQHLDATLERLKEYGLRVRKDKCEFFQLAVEYLGHVIDASGLHTSPSKVKAIVDAPIPKNVSQLRSFLGLLNYYGRFIPNIATLLKPLHKLLCHENNWKWTSECQESFIKAKETLLGSNALTHFDPALPIQLACDASPYGVGAVLSHIMPNGQERPIAFASRSLSKAEANYAQIEREALSIVFGVRKFYQYIFGRKFTLLTDHRPLTAIFGPHHGIPTLAASRMQRWALLLSAHTYDIKYRKSELHGNADGLSRLPLAERVKEAKVAEIFYFNQVERAPITAAQVRRGTRNDPVLSRVVDMVMTGKGERHDLELKPYISRRHELSVQSGCLLWGRRVVIPPALRKQVLKQLHVGHCGMVRMKEIARSYFWWPGVDGQIEEKARTCTSCQHIRNAPQLAPLHPWEFPEKPWHRIHIDFAGPVEDKMLLVVMDAHSKWPEVAIMKSTSAEKTIEKLGEIFSRFGSPVQLVSDNGPQFTSHEMATFLQANGVQHITSSPYHPATNGLAERFVQTMKHALKASLGQGTFHQRLHSFLLSYRSTPHATTKVSPAYLLFGREVRTSFELIKPATLKETVQRQQEHQVQRRNLRAKDRNFATGSAVLARNYGSGPKWVPATVEAQTGPVSYKVKTDENLSWRRHTDQLLGAASTVTDLPEITDVTDQIYDNSPTSEVSTNEPMLTTNGSFANKSSPSSPENGNQIGRRYPVRERRPPQRLLDYT